MTWWIWLPVSLIGYTVIGLATARVYYAERRTYWMAKVASKRYARQLRDTFRYSGRPLPVWVDRESAARKALQEASKAGAFWPFFATYLACALTVRSILKAMKVLVTHNIPISQAERERVIEELEEERNET